MKTLTKSGLSIILLVVCLSGCQSEQPPMNHSNNDTVPNKDSGKPKVPIRKVFSNKIVYTTSMDENESKLRKHCNQQEGTFNTCGSICAPDAKACAEVCAYTCENIQN